MKIETKNWLYFASNDIHMISDNINTEDPEATGAIAVFCQQAVEKYFKAYLIEHSIEFPRTHWSNAKRKHAYFRRNKRIYRFC